MLDWMKKKTSSFDEDVDNLALRTALSVNKYLQTTKSEYLGKSQLTKLDSVVFACFLIRAFCLGTSRNRETASTFSNKFIGKFLVHTKDLHAPNDIQLLQKVFDNRTAFYDRVFMSKDDINAKVKAIQKSLN